MDCPTCEAMVESYLDGELPAGESARFEAALAECPECRARLERLQAQRVLIRDLPTARAPDLLRARIDRELRIDTPTPAPTSRVWPRRTALAASLVLAVGVGWAGGRFMGRQGSRETDELIAGYLRVGLGDRPVEVASSDQHTVKPWFAGRIDYAPPVYDLTASGFPLLGGRVDVLDGRRIAVLVYRRNQHRVALSLWPASTPGNLAAQIGERDGFAIARWRHAGFEMRAVADLVPKDMSLFAAAVDRAIDAGR